jgi:hypothetical protein
VREVPASEGTLHIVAGFIDISSTVMTQHCALNVRYFPVLWISEHFHLQYLAGRLVAV